MKAIEIELTRPAKGKEMSYEQYSTIAEYDTIEGFTFPSKNQAMKSISSDDAEYIITQLERGNTVKIIK